MKVQLFSFSVVKKLYPSCILLESYGLWKSKNNETTISRKTHLKKEEKKHTTL